MQLYFVKANYTNNVYKISDFYLNNDYKLIASKMLNINWKPSDGESSLITTKTTLPDETKIWEHTHFIVPEYDKIYKIISIDYMNNNQYNINALEDPLIGNYLELKEKDIILNRTNDLSFFRGQNDVADLTLKETVETKVIQSESRTGKWALLFMQINADKDRFGLKFRRYTNILEYETFSTLADVITAYPEISTEEPSKVDYFQKKVFVIGTYLQVFQCVYNETSGVGKLYWLKFEEVISTLNEVYFELDDAVGGRYVESDIRNLIIALPFESVILGDHTTNDPYLLSWNNFIGPIDSGELIDIKIVDDIILPFTGVTYNLNTTQKTMRKNLLSNSGEIAYIPIYPDDTSTTENANYQLLSIIQINTTIDLDPQYISGTINAKDAEPFYKYELYIFGQRFSIPYFLTNDLHLLIAINSGVINYIIYYNDKRNILASGSFTHSAKYQIDQLDAFYNQNPTYKDQFYLKMGGSAIKNVGIGALGGFVQGGAAGAVIGASGGIASTAVDAGLSLMNLKYMEEGQRLKPDQIFGDISETALQLLNLFAIYFVKRTSTNIDLMLTEYSLKGFPTAIVKSIDDLDYTISEVFSTSKVIFGEIKTVIKNEYVTRNINEKLRDGIILIP